MRLIYNSSNDIGVFPKDPGCTPYIKSEYANKTFYCVYEVKNDYCVNKSNGWYGDKTLYKKGYYVIPVYLEAKRWVCGNKIIMWPRTFSNTCYNEPQDVPWEKCRFAYNYKSYWGLTETTLGYLNYYAEDVELYDDVNEAIKRAKDLDVLMKINEDLDNIKYKLRSRKSERDKLDFYLRYHSAYKHHGTQQQQLEYQLKELTYKKKLVTIDKLYDKKQKLESKQFKYIQYKKYETL